MEEKGQEEALEVCGHIKRAWRGKLEDFGMPKIWIWVPGCSLQGTRSNIFILQSRLLGLPRDRYRLRQKYNGERRCIAWVYHC